MHFPLKLLVASVQWMLWSSNLANLTLAVCVTLFWPAKTNSMPLQQIQYSKHDSKVYYLQAVCHKIATSVISEPKLLDTIGHGKANADSSPSQITEVRSCQVNFINTALWLLLVLVSFSVTGHFNHDS